MSDGIWSIPRSPPPIFPHTLIDNNKNSSRKIDNFMANYWRQTTILQWFELTPCGISIIIGQVLFFSFLYFSSFLHPSPSRTLIHFEMPTGSHLVLQENHNYPSNICSDNECIQCVLGFSARKYSIFWDFEHPGQCHQCVLLLILLTRRFHNSDMNFNCLILSENVNSFEFIDTRNCKHQLFYN